MQWFNKAIGLDSLFIFKIGQEMINKTRKIRAKLTPAQKLEYAKLRVEEDYSNQKIIELSGTG